MGVVRRRSRRRGRGQTLVELAFVLPIFLLMLMILIDFGRVIYAQHTITQQAREASRLGAVSAESLQAGDFAARYAAIRAAAKIQSPGVAVPDTAITGPAGSGNCNTHPPMPSDPVVATRCFYPNGTIQVGTAKPYVAVTIQVTVPILTPIISTILGGSIGVSATSQSFIQS
jgi:Flp pilus assembly protein TadG